MRLCVNVRPGACIRVGGRACVQGACLAHACAHVWPRACGACRMSRLQREVPWSPENGTSTKPGVHAVRLGPTRTPGRSCTRCPPGCSPARQTLVALLHSLLVMIHATLPGDPLMDTYYGWICAPVVAGLQPVQPCCLRNCSMWGCVSAGSRTRFAGPARRRWWSRHRATRDRHSCGAQPFPRHPDRPGRDCVSWVSSSLRSETALRPSVHDGCSSASCS